MHSPAPPSQVTIADPNLRLDCYGLRRHGRERSTNQDQFLIADMSKALTPELSSLELAPDGDPLLGKSEGKLLAVADGAGGPMGQGASREALRALVNQVLDVMPWFHRIGQGGQPFVQAGLEQALLACDRAVTEAAPEEARWAHETTLTAACVVGPHVYGVHAGNSRAYILRDGAMTQITRDQTFAQQLLEAGAINPSEMAEMTLDQGSFSAVGGANNTTVLQSQSFVFDLLPGDVLLLCTDGLTDRVSQEGISAFVVQAATAEKACRKLGAAASLAGGEDDLAVVVARVVAETR